MCKFRQSYWMNRSSDTICGWTIVFTSKLKHKHTHTLGDNFNCSQWDEQAKLVFFSAIWKSIVTGAFGWNFSYIHTVYLNDIFVEVFNSHIQLSTINTKWSTHSAHTLTQNFISTFTQKFISFYLFRSLITELLFRLIYSNFFLLFFLSVFTANFELLYVVVGVLNEFFFIEMHLECRKQMKWETRRKKISL